MAMPATDNLCTWRLCVAPMLGWTHRHCRYFLRLLTRHTRLYTEMVTTAALLRGDHRRWLRCFPCEHPVALQLGGSDPRDLACCARAGADWGYDEINLNLGCPSDRAQAGRFGACLLAEPALVAECVAAMKAAVDVPVTVKTRIGIDHHDSYVALCAFTRAVRDAGCDALIVHARKAWLQGLSPRENRHIPPLRPEVVVQLKADFPELPVVLNGGITDLAQAQGFLPAVDGVMIGRAAYHNPWLLAAADRVFFGHAGPPPTRRQVLERFVVFAEQERQAGVSLSAMVRPLFGLYQGRPGARRWRQHLSDQLQRPDASARVLLEALPEEDPPVAAPSGEDCERPRL